MKPSSLFRTAWIIVIALSLPVPATAQWPPEIKNLKVFPKDTEIGELMDEMKSFSFGLGVRCQYCHIGEEGQPLSSFDFASDEKASKDRARTMILMTRAINDEHLASFKRGDQPALRVECVTCHRSVPRPEQLHDILSRVAIEKGAEAAIEKYGQLRTESYGGHSYDFGEKSLVIAAGSLADQGKVELAMPLLLLNLEHHPESIWTLGVLASAQEESGNRQSAITTLERLLEVRPGDTRTLKQLEALRASGEESTPDQ